MKEEIAAKLIDLSDGFRFASLCTLSSGKSEGDTVLLSSKSSLIAMSSESDEGLDCFKQKHVDVNGTEDDEVNSLSKKKKNVKSKKSKDQKRYE